MSEIMSIEGMTKDYIMGKEVIHALNSVSLSIQQNEYVALMGPSGSGKSTLMNMIGLLDTPTSGKYVLNSQDVSRLNDNEMAVIRNKEIGFIFQTFNLMPRLNALENVALPLIYAGAHKTQREERSKEMLKAVGLEERMF